MNWASKDDAAEWAIDVAAAATFAASVAMAAWALTAAGAAAVVAAALAFLLACAVLRRIPAEIPRYELPAFELAPLEFAVAAGDSTDELLLEDQLRLDSGARVVQLFGSGPGPAASNRGFGPADASEALSEALAELRRSLH